MFATYLRRRRLSGLGAIQFVLGVAFNNNDAYNDFVRGVTLRGSTGSWTGVTTSIINLVDGALKTANNSQDPKHLAVAVEYQQKIIQGVRDVESFQSFGFGGRSESQDAMYKQAMTNLKSTLIAYINAVNQLPPAVPQTAPGTAAMTTGGSSALQTAQSFSASPGLILGGMFAVAAVAGIIVLATSSKKKSHAVSGLRGVKGSVGTSRSGKQLKTTIKKNEDGEYVVKLWVDGKHYAPADYFGSDKEDAQGTAREMIRDYKG
jgi:hypothetical protein